MKTETTTNQWPLVDNCADCGGLVRLLVVDRAADSASGHAPGDPVYGHAPATDPEQPELCPDGSTTASTALRDLEVAA